MPGRDLQESSSSSSSSSSSDSESDSSSTSSSHSIDTSLTATAQPAEVKILKEPQDKRQILHKYHDVVSTQYHCYHCSIIDLVNDPSTIVDLATAQTTMINKLF